MSDERPLTNPNARPIGHPIFPIGIPRHRIIKLTTACWHKSEHPELLRPLHIPPEDV